MGITDTQEWRDALEADAKREVEELAERLENRRLFENHPGEYREGFIDGYLRAHADGDEYACPVAHAEAMFGKYLRQGGRTLPRQDVSGW